MKLSLSVLKKGLISEGVCDEEFEIKNNEWIKNNIGDEDVDVDVWLGVFSEYWNKMGGEYGDSDVIEEILVRDYKLSKEDVEYIMGIYWND
jgi:hypothetical protein